MLREVVAEVLDERAALAEARQKVGAQSEAEELASIRRCNLTPKEKARLIERIGFDRYIQLKRRPAARQHRALSFPVS